MWKYFDKGFVYGLKDKVIMILLLLITIFILYLNLKLNHIASENEWLEKWMSIKIQEKALLINSKIMKK